MVEWFRKLESDIKQRNQDFYAERVVKQLSYRTGVVCTGVMKMSETVQFTYVKYAWNERYMSQ
jgi:hypothetical protein